MKLLIGIPMLTGYGHCKAAIESISGFQDTELLLVSNGAEESVYNLIQNTNCLKIVNEKNIYVNASWNQIMATFLSGAWDYLIIMNSDLVLQKKALAVCINRWEKNPDEILIPVMDGIMPDDVYCGIIGSEIVTEGTPGVFITLNRKQAEIVYPIPETLKVWFGDNWIYGKLRKAGYETIIPYNLLALHAWSSTVSKVKGISEIIEQDKVEWEKIKHQL